jgi:acetoin utilization deacetylase AcuC-like enzyme
VRPPGHHAIRDKGMGFCIFGNVAIAIMHAKAVHKLGKVATVDWDVHHGNGTQQAFYEDPSVLTISIHQDRLFPSNSGGVEEIGAGAGEGYNINIPMPPGSASRLFGCLERVVARRRSSAPEIVCPPASMPSTDPSAA